MYRALYRKYRPLTFDDVIGQNDIVTALTSQVANQKTGHAYIFTGTRGTGKTTCAKIFAKAINCTDTKNGNPCGECAICKGVENGSLVDVVEIDAASNNGVDSIRDLREETAYTPSVAKYKVYIIDEVHMLSTAAFNALLKIMEEPPAHIVFILATTEIHKVPATILSRCQRYDFMRISPTEINARLCHVATEENIELTREAANLISRLADGAMRDALSILDTCSSTGGVIDEIMVQKMAGVTDKSYLFKLSDAIAKRDAAAAICLLADIRTGCSDTKRII
ncbi:MAG: DNA polymerase III subunit gamma/tau, partial [Oscillospiraceae bacterium]